MWRGCTLSWEDSDNGYEGSRDDASRCGRANRGVQKRAIESQERGSASQITGVVKIGRDSGNDEHRSSEARQMLPASSRDGERCERVCDRFQGRFPESC
jgi:hypothetical protein